MVGKENSVLTFLKLAFDFFYDIMMVEAGVFQVDQRADKIQSKAVIIEGSCDLPVVGLKSVCFYELFLDFQEEGFKCSLIATLFLYFFREGIFVTCEKIAENEID